MNAKELGQQSTQRGEITTGLTKRELFAAMAMHGFLSNPSLTVNDEKVDGVQAVAEASLKLADVLLTELTKDQS